MERTWTQITAEWLKAVIEENAYGVDHVSLAGNEITYVDYEPSPPINVRISIICGGK